MTINALHKLTARLIADGCGRREVCINKDTFQHPLEGDGAVILEVEAGEIETFPMCDDDGGIKYLDSGREVTRMGLVLKGDAGRAT